MVCINKIAWAIILLLTPYFLMAQSINELESEIRYSQVYDQDHKLFDKAHFESVEVTKYNEALGEITIEDIDGREKTLYFNDKTVFKNLHSKTSESPKSLITEGTVMSIAYEIADNKRIALDITLPKILRSKNRSDKDITLTGVLEGRDGGLAIVGGRRVQLQEGVVITCNSKSNCDCKCPGMKKEAKGKMDYLLDEELISIAPLVEIKGLLQSDGVVIAEKFEIRENIETKSEISYLAKLGETVDIENMVITPKNNFSRLSFKGKMRIAESTYNLFENSEAQIYINTVGEKLIPDWYKSMSAKRDNAIGFYVINSTEPDAFSQGDGKIFVTTALLRMIKNEHQLAFILAHEIAHVTHKHSVQLFEKSEMMRITMNVINTTAKIASALTNNQKTKDIIQSTLEVIEALKPIYFSSIFPYKKELQADRVGLYYLKNAGYNINEVPKLWEGIKTKLSEKSFVESFANAALHTVSNCESFIRMKEQKKLNSQDLINSVKSFAVNLYMDSQYLSVSKVNKRASVTNAIINLEYASYKPKSSFEPKNFNQFIRVIK